MNHTTLLLGLLTVGILNAGCQDINDSIDEEEETDSAQQAFTTDAWAYAWAQQSTGTYTAASSYSRNSSGDWSGSGVNNTVSQIATGEYYVDFPGIGGVSGGNVQVTAYGSTAARCKVDHWGVSSSVRAYVNCFSAAGAPVNTLFTVAYIRRSGTGGSDAAYLWANSPTASSYTPHATYQFNSSGASNTIARQGVGMYAVTLPGLGAVGATVEVTAYGSSSDHCKVSGWSQSGSDTVVHVRCFNAAGALSDSLFTLNFAGSAPPNGVLTYSYAWANNPTAASYTPTLSYQRGFIAGAGEVNYDTTVERTSTGRYTMTMPGMWGPGSNVQITAFGTGSEHCKVVSWTKDPPDGLINVACFDASGAPADSRFVAVYNDTTLVIL